MPTTILHTSDGKLDAGDRQALDALKARLGAAPSKVLLHLHGGLVAQADGEAVAHALSGNGPQAFNAEADYEQIYVVWRTGALETIRTNWQDLFQNDRLYRALFKHLIGYVSSKIGAEDGSGRSVGLATGLSPAEIERRMNSGADAPFADLDRAVPEEPAARALRLPLVTDVEIRGEFGAALQMSAEFSRAIEDLAAAVSWDASGRSATEPHGNAALGRQSLARLQRDVREELETARQTPEGRGLITSAVVLKAMVKHGVAIAIRVIRRLRNGRSHGVHATIVEELARELYGDLIGSAIWGMMKKDAGDHFSISSLGTELIEALAGHPHRIVVTAHSAGSIWASAMLLAAASKVGFPKVDLILLAPAVRVREFAEAVDKARPLIARFRMFTMRDELERADAVLGRGTGAIYPSSLLYLVSGLFEESDGEAAPDAPLLGMERFLNRSPEWLEDAQEIAAITAIRNFLAGIPDSAIYSKASGAAGLSTDATTHGDFDNNALTLASVRELL